VSESELFQSLKALSPAINATTERLLEINRRVQETPRDVAKEMIESVVSDIDSLVEAYSGLEEVVRSKGAEWREQSLEQFGVGVKNYCSTLEVFKIHLMVQWQTAPRDISGFPLLWELFGFALRRRTRERIFEPAYQDMFAQHLKARQFTGKWERRWLNFCFALRTIGLVLSCWRIATWTAAITIAFRLIPANVKEWALHLFR
jgi:hypothetical protein